MADQDMLVCTAVYTNVDEALADLDALEDAHDAQFVGHYDAAVIENEEGKPRIVRRRDRPRTRAIPELFGAGSLPRKQLKEAAAELSSHHAGLVAVGEPTLEAGFDKAVTRAAKVVKNSFDSATDELAHDLQEAVKS